MEQLSTLDPLDVGARVDELKLLKPGWLNGAGVPPAHDGLDWLTGAFDCYFPENLPLPYLYPTPAGGARFEWSIQAYELSLEIDLASRNGFWHSLNVLDDTEQTMTLNLEHPVCWERLAAELRRLVEAHA